jgi:small-conductance mechanosensitive channel
VEAVRTLLLEAAEAHPLFLDTPGPNVQVIEANDLGVTVRLMAWTASQSNAYTLATDVREAVLAKLPGVASPVGLVTAAPALATPEAPRP